MSRIVNFETACRIISESRNRKALLTFHSVGDRDGVGSAMALSQCFNDYVVATPDFVTNNVKRMLSEIGYERKIGHAFPEDREIIVITDANNLGVMGAMKEKIQEFDGLVLFIDHHVMGTDGLPDNFMIFNSEEFNSASSIAYEMMKENREEVSKAAALLLLNGIISDSADFQNATPTTFGQVGELLGIAGVDYSEILEYFHEDVSADDRYRLMGDVFSAKREVVGNYIIMYGTSGESAGLAAETAIKFGADAAVFWVVDEKEGRLSARLRAPLDKRLSIHLGKLLQEAGGRLGGSGGGHPCAAGGYGPRREKAEEVSAGVVDFVRKRFSQGQ